MSFCNISFQHWPKSHTYTFYWRVGSSVYPMHFFQDFFSHTSSFFKTVYTGNFDVVLMFILNSEIQRNFHRLILHPTFLVYSIKVRFHP